jgi:hypothetical protein
VLLVWAGGGLELLSERQHFLVARNGQTTMMYVQSVEDWMVASNPGDAMHDWENEFFKEKILFSRNNIFFHPTLLSPIYMLLVLFAMCIVVLVYSLKMLFSHPSFGPKL